eukprot:TRINITY_DN33986_c0_g1_i4.p1 TRINITY_DN33986_c0_g1~~TRINITY_DN33986_c0_g1_i4.p1  ORF type:complete len:101 (-),score=9.24 TRINITY_DN33986_c0_g1_i4:52-354(-)
MADLVVSRLVLPSSGTSAAEPCELQTTASSRPTPCHWLSAAAELEAGTMCECDLETLRALLCLRISSAAQRSLSFSLFVHLPPEGFLLLPSVVFNRFRSC